MSLIYLSSVIHNNLNYLVYFVFATHEREEIKNETEDREDFYEVQLHELVVSFV